MRKSFLEIVVIVLAVFSLGVMGYAKEKKAKTPAPAATPAPTVTEEVKYFSSADVKAAFDKGATLVPGDGRNYRIIGGKHENRTAMPSPISRLTGNTNKHAARRGRSVAVGPQPGRATRRSSKSSLALPPVEAVPCALSVPSHGSGLSLCGDVRHILR